MSAIPTRLTPALSTALYRESRSTRSDRNESSEETIWGQCRSKQIARPHSIRTSDLEALGLDKLDDFERSLGDVGHVLAVTVLAEEAGGANDNVKAVDAGLDGQLGVAHVASDVCCMLGLLSGRQTIRRVTHV